MPGTGDKHPRDLSNVPWWVRDFLLALGFLTRLPVSAIDPGDRKLLRAGWCFPLVGVVVGAVGAVAVWIAYSVGLPLMVCGLGALAGTALLTGALHEDGLADLADGFGGGRDKASKIAIMRDSRIGTYGVLALILVTGLKAAAIASLVLSAGVVSACIALIVVHACARGLILPVALLLQSASGDGLGEMAGKPKLSTVQVSLGISAALLLIMLPAFTAVIAAAAGCAVVAVIALLARRHIGGYTGDVLGAVEQAAEVAILLALAARMAGGT
jgi:adenosylcobinamide-GDP ribazoletransferase